VLHLGEARRVVRVAGPGGHRARSVVSKCGVGEWTQPVQRWQQQRNRTKGGPRLQQSPRARALPEGGGDGAGRKRSATEAGGSRVSCHRRRRPRAFAVLSEGVEGGTLPGDPTRVRVPKTAVPAVGTPTRIWKAEVLASLGTGASATTTGGATHDRVAELVREEGLAELLPEKLTRVDHLRLRTAPGERSLPDGAPVGSLESLRGGQRRRYVL
jgi:hypothetical protein